MKSEEIAKLAGVSRSTVSRVINNYANVPQATRDKVMKVIKKYNFEPNMSARVLAGKGTDTLGLFLFSIYNKKNPLRVYGNSYFGPFLDAVVDTGNYKGFYILIHTIYTPQECRYIEQTFSQKRIDGGIIIGTESNPEIEAVISNTHYPLAIIDYDPKKIKKLMHKDGKIVLINSLDRQGIRKAIDKLVSLGHKTIGFIEGRDTTYSGYIRKDEFIKSMKDHGLPIKNEFMLKGDFVRSKTEIEVSKMIEKGKLPTAIIACNDEMALAAMDTLRAYNISIPDDISIIGFDDSPAASLVEPSLTTVRIPFYTMAQKAVEYLSDMIENKSEGLIHHEVDVELTMRKSCTINKIKD